MKEQKLHVIPFQKIVGNAYIWLLDTHKTISNGLVKLEQNYAKIHNISSPKPRLKRSDQLIKFQIERFALNSLETWSIQLIRISNRKFFLKFTWPNYT